jgi:hypothetical protein
LLFEHCEQGRLNEFLETKLAKNMFIDEIVTKYSGGSSLNSDDICWKVCNIYLYLMYIPVVRFRVTRCRPGPNRPSSYPPNPPRGRFRQALGKMTAKATVTRYSKGLVILPKNFKFLNFAGKILTRKVTSPIPSHEAPGLGPQLQICPCMPKILIRQILTNVAPNVHFASDST